MTGLEPDAVRVAEHRTLVESLFPSLDTVEFEPVGEGWTCDTYLVDGSRIVQLPRSGFAAEMLRKQLAVLPELTREVSAQIPVPELSSADPVAMGYRRIDGVPCTEVDRAGM